MTDSQKERRGDLQHEVRHHRPTYEGLGNRFQVCVHSALSKKPYSFFVAAVPSRERSGGFSSAPFRWSQIDHFVTAITSRRSGRIMPFFRS
jgi:hypothetical protein